MGKRTNYVSYACKRSVIVELGETVRNLPSGNMATTVTYSNDFIINTNNEGNIRSTMNRADRRNEIDDREKRVSYESNDIFTNGYPVPVNKRTPVGENYCSRFGRVTIMAKKRTGIDRVVDKRIPSNVADGVL